MVAVLLIGGLAQDSAFRHRLARRWQPGLRCLTALIALTFAVAVQAQSVPATDNIMVVMSESTDAYQQVAERMRVRFELNAPERAQFTLLTAQAVSAKGAEVFSSSQLVVTVGVQAAQLVHGYDLRAPVLHTLIPKASYEKMLQAKPATSTQSISALYIDQPVSRQLELIRCVLPQALHVGALLGSDGVVLQKSLDLAAKPLGQQMETESVRSPEELPQALRRVLARSDALLALPDAQVYNQSTLPNILLNAYRNKEPVFGFSAGQVKAGALAAVFSTPEQIGNQAGELLLQAGANGKWVLPAPQSPRYFNVAVNRDVSRSLGLTVEEDIVLQEKLKRSARSE
jgi:putative tryptophan/tyrosine transport system substrate-binding protein